MVRQAFRVKITEGIIESLHVVKPFGDFHIGGAAIACKLASYCGGAKGVARLVDRSKSLPCFLCVFCVFDEVQPACRDSGDDSCEGGFVTSCSGCSSCNCLVVLIVIAWDVDGSENDVLIGAVMSDWLTKGGNKWRFGVRSLDVLEEIPVV
jgi:hypothetical protein